MRHLCALEKWADGLLARNLCVLSGGVACDTLILSMRGKRMVSMALLAASLGSYASFSHPGQCPELDGLAARRKCRIFMYSRCCSCRVFGDPL